jgi:hypothetical protein
MIDEDGPEPMAARFKNRRQRSRSDVFHVVEQLDRPMVPTKLYELLQIKLTTYCRRLTTPDEVLEVLPLQGYS